MQYSSFKALKFIHSFIQSLLFCFFSQIKNINGDVVFTIESLNFVIFSLEYEKIGRGYNTLDENDYIISTDENTLFIKITKALESKAEYHLKIKVLLRDKKIGEWLILFMPIGLITFIIYIISKHSWNIRVQPLA